MNAVKSEAESAGEMSEASEAALRACAGLTNDFARNCIVINGISKTESAKAAERAQAGQRGGTGPTKEGESEHAKGAEVGSKTEAEERKVADNRTVRVLAIENIAVQLRGRKILLEGIEKWQDKTRLVAAVLPADCTCDRFSRAETAFDRRCYRALAALLGMKQAKDAFKILP